jgi:hypothetical protein
MLVVPSDVEREYAESKDSETACALALERLADNGLRSRVLSGIVNASAGVASLLFPFNFITPYDSVYSAVSSLGMAAYDFLFPSKAELAYARDLELAGQGG